jgi:Tol biopolymer transport system component
LLYQNGLSILTKLTFTDRSGKELMAVGEPARVTDFALSPEEKRVVIARANLTANESTGRDLWMYDLEHQTTSQFTTKATNSRPVWSPDGTRVAFSSNRTGRTDLYEKPATGAVAEQTIYATKDSPKFGFDWTRDGKFLLYVDILRGGKSGADILALPAGGGKPLPVIQAEFNQTKPQLSPDNRWLAYVSDESGRGEVYVQPFSLEGKPSTQRWQISASGGTDPRWRRDGRELFFLAADQKLMSVAIRSATEKVGAPEFAFDSPQSLFTLPPMFTLPVTSNGVFEAMAFRYAVTADGKRFLVLADSGNSTPAPITVLTNWQAGLKK